MTEVIAENPRHHWRKFYVTNIIIGLLSIYLYLIFPIHFPMLAIRYSPLFRHIIMAQEHGLPFDLQDIKKRFGDIAPRLIEYSLGSCGNFKRKSIYLLVSLEDKRSIDTFIKLKIDSDDKIRILSLIGLARINDPRARAEIPHFLLDKDQHIRSFCAQIMSEMP